VTSQTRNCVATTVGAVAGAVAGYMLVSDQGRAWRQQLERVVDEAAQELGRFRETVIRAAGVAGDGWRLFDEAKRQTRAPLLRDPNPYQMSPF
jgi:hypothetical protein